MTFLFLNLLVCLPPPPLLTEILTSSISGRGYRAIHLLVFLIKKINFFTHFIPAMAPMWTKPLPPPDEANIDTRWSLTFFCLISNKSIWVGLLLLIFSAKFRVLNGFSVVSMILLRILSWYRTSIFNFCLGFFFFKVLNSFLEIFMIWSEFPVSFSISSLQPLVWTDGVKTFLVSFQ